MMWQDECNPLELLKRVSELSDVLSATEEEEFMTASVVPNTWGRRAPANEEVCSLDSQP